MCLIHHLSLGKRAIIKCALCDLSDHGGEQQLNLFVARVTLGTNGRKLNVEMEEKETSRQGWKGGRNLEYSVLPRGMVVFQKAKPTFKWKCPRARPENSWSVW